MEYDFFNLRRLGGCKPLPANVRFEQSYVPDPNSGCWLWLGTYRGSNHYGSIKADGKFWVAHRYSWYLHHGEFDENLLVCHRCDNPSCVNPKHLFLGTHQINSDDKVNKFRHSKGAKHSAAVIVNCARGERNAHAKLTTDKVLQIRSDSRSNIVIGKEFGISGTMVGNIKNRKAWRHV